MIQGTRGKLLECKKRCNNWKSNQSRLEALLIKEILIIKIPWFFNMNLSSFQVKSFLCQHLSCLRFGPLFPDFSGATFALLPSIFFPLAQLLENFGKNKINKQRNGMLAYYFWRKNLYYWRALRYLKIQSLAQLMCRNTNWVNNTQSNTDCVLVFHNPPASTWIGFLMCHVPSDSP